MLFYSTNQITAKADFRKALFSGQAPDRGLYMPETIPALSADDFAAMEGESYPRVASSVLHRFVGDFFTKGELDLLCDDAYRYPVPLERVEDRLFVLRLDRGPTASFKDFAASMMSRMMLGLRKGSGRKLVVLTATSGDTGGAVARAFFDLPGIDVIVLFPPGEVSERQRRQMTTLGKNITAIGVEGKFDHCQALVKQAFADQDMEAVDLTSANSINIGRLLPQAVYYIYAYMQAADPGEAAVFSIPSGNFGNMMGALLAKRMGLPVSRLVIATNSNDEVPVFFRTEEYRVVDPSRVCLSNAMNVGHPSNFARVVDLYGGRMDEKGRMLRQPDVRRMREDMFAVSIDDDETRRTIRDAWKLHRLMLEPHGAAGWAGLERYRSETGERGLCVSVETAHPAKFPEEIESLLGFSPDIPDSLRGLETLRESFIRMPPEYGAFREFLRERYLR
jgi:threonine synthase